jgi:16S rRNA processing protein RimM
MTYEKMILLGRITRLHGYEGTVIVRLEKESGDYLQKMETVFIEIEGILVPFFISDSEVTGESTLWLKFDGYEGRERVAEFIGCRIFAAGENSTNESEQVIEDLIGFEVSVKGRKVIGIVRDVLHNPGQDLLVLESALGKEILIPLHIDLISDYNEAERTLELDIPEGLENLNE